MPRRFLLSGKSNIKLKSSMKNLLLQLMSQSKILKVLSCRHSADSIKGLPQLKPNWLKRTFQIKVKKALIITLKMWALSMIKLWKSQGIKVFTMQINLSAQLTIQTLRILRKLSLILISATLTAPISWVALSKVHRLDLALAIQWQPRLTIIKPLNLLSTF